METMKAIVAREPGGPEVLQLQDRPRPVPARGEMLVEVEASGVNRPDLRQRLGHYPPPPGVVDIIGLEVAGTVVAVGADVDGAWIGRRVCALLAGGGYAGYAVAPVEQVLPVPSRLSTVEAAAIPETFFTVWTNLFRIGRLAPHETVLVHGGASGIGTTAIQLAKAHGARVIATAGGPGKVEACLRLGADVAIDYKVDDFVARTMEATGGRGVDVILDLVCADYLGRNLDALAVGGRLVVIAFLGGGKAMVDVERLVRRRQTITGSTLRPQSPAEKGLIAKDLLEIVWPWIEEGKVGPVVNSTYPLRDAAKAHAELESGKHVGKIVLTRT